MASNLYIVLITIIVVLSFRHIVDVEGAKASCRAARTCCEGEDDDCLVFDTSKNDNEYADIDEDADNEGEAVEPCYCDHGCAELGDCCPDYFAHCRIPVDCEVGNWSPWSACKCSSSNAGNSVRRRHVLKRAANGGQSCPKLLERKKCEETICNQRRHVSAFGETAILVPAEFAVKSSGYEVRANLKSFRRNKERNGLNRDTSYCVKFRVEKAAKACATEPSTAALLSETVLRVSCDSSAQRSYLGNRCLGHGVRGKRTKFKSVLNDKCHGKWIRIGDEQCSQFNFVFV